MTLPEIVDTYCRLLSHECELELKLASCRKALTKLRSEGQKHLPAERATPGEAQAKYVLYLENLFNKEPTE